jgi:hypothetical protein
MSRYHLAQLNIARMRAPLESPIMADFVAKLDRVNALADDAPGFVWRLQTEDGDATGLRYFGDDMLVNLSVWETVDALRRFVYQSTHLDIMRRRKEWFARMAEPYLVLWWVEAGHLPSLPESAERLQRLREHGPGPQAFTFKHLSPPPAAGMPPATASTVDVDSR